MTKLVALPGAELSTTDLEALIVVERTLSPGQLLFRRLLLLVLALTLWEVTVRLGLVKEFAVSRPSLIAEWFVSNAGKPALWNHFFVTLREAVAGLLLGVAGGTSGALWLARSDGSYQVLRPYIMALYSIPRIALAPLFILWFGLGDASKIALAASLVVFVVFFNTYSGVMAVDRRLVEALLTMGATQRFIYRHLVLPSTLPYVFSAIRISVGLALVAVIAGEFLGGSQGLGYVVLRSANLFYMSETMGVVGILGVLGLLAETGMSAAERRLFVWRPRSRTA